MGERGEREGRGRRGGVLAMGWLETKQVSTGVQERPVGRERE